MKVLLVPRTDAAYGQDFLAARMEKVCGLTRVTPETAGYPSLKNLELVVSQNLDQRFDSALFSSLNSTPAVAHIHCQLGFYSGEQATNLMRGLDRTSIGIVPARFLQNVMEEAFPMIKWQTVHNGVDATRFRVADHQERVVFRKRLNVPQKSLLVATVGRLENAKGLQILAEFCRRLRGTDITLLIQYLANNSSTGRLYAEHAERLREMCPEQIILFRDMDICSERPVRHCDLLLTTSLSEVCPLVVLEAFACGLPVAGTLATPFYGDLLEIGIPGFAFWFHPLPIKENFDVPRKQLMISDSGAKQLAAILLEHIHGFAAPTDAARYALSCASKKAGLTDETMLHSFSRVYESAISEWGLHR